MPAALTLSNCGRDRIFGAPGFSKPFLAVNLGTERPWSVGPAIFACRLPSIFRKTYGFSAFGGDIGQRFFSTSQSLARFEMISDLECRKPV